MNDEGRRGTELFDLEGRVAIVTGSTRGIGRAIVEGFARAGAAVVVSSRKQDRCEAIAAQIRNVSGAAVLPLACHVGEWDAVPSFVTQVLERFGRIDVLVNNAGIFPVPTKVSDVTSDHWRKVFSVNLEGPLRMSQCVAPVMRDGGGGSIVHIGSTAARWPGSPTCAYAASKAALVNLARSMAMEWAPWNVRVNVLSPGTIATDLTLAGESGGAAYLEQRSRGIMLGRVGEPIELVGPALYLASDASSFVTGDEITVSGGKLS